MKDIDTHVKFGNVFYARMVKLDITLDYESEISGSTPDMSTIYKRREAEYLSTITVGMRH